MELCTDESRRINHWCTGQGYGEGQRKRWDAAGPVHDRARPYSTHETASRGLVKGVDPPLPLLGYPPGVVAQRGGWVGVAELCAHVGEWRAVGQQQARVRVAKIVHMVMRKPSSLQQTPEDAPVAP
jgi:hypothetical protein